MLEYLPLILAGCLAGTITGLTPGLHVNTVCLIGLSLYAGLGLDAIEFSVFMVAMAITQQFLDFIPAIFLGVPEEETALSILPAHRLLMEGKALEAVKLTGYGCLMGVVFGLLLLLPALYVIPIIYHWIRGFVVYVIALAALFLMMREGGWSGRLWAAIIFLVSGALGSLTLNLEGISSTYVLFPVFAGLFGLSSILYSMKSEPRNIPQEEYARVEFDREVIGGGLSGAIGGMVVGVLPAMSPSQIGIIMSGVFGSSLRGFLVSVSAINTSDAMYSIISLYTINNARSGVAVMIGRILEMDYSLMVLFVGVFCVSAVIALFLHIEIGKRANMYFKLVDYRLLSAAVVAFILTLVYVMTGWLGLLISIVSTAIGMLPIMSGVSRTHLMGVLIIPTIFFFLGL
ncbi:MAG: tripartite tricarboxylate transporter permease [Candidatus Altiarchaeota archaeon]